MHNGIHVHLRDDVGLECMGIYQFYDAKQGSDHCFCHQLAPRWMLHHSLLFCDAGNDQSVRHDVHLLWSDPHFIDRLHSDVGQYQGAHCQEGATFTIMIIILSYSLSLSHHFALFSLKIKTELICSTI